MAEIDTTEMTKLELRETAALDLWMTDPSYTNVAGRMGVAISTARRYVLAAIRRRTEELLPSVDGYLLATVDRITKRLGQLDEAIDRGTMAWDKAMPQERGYIEQLVKLLGLGAPERHVHLVAEVRPLTDEERRQRAAKLLTAGRLLDDGGPDGRDPAGASNGRPVGPAPQE